MFKVLITGSNGFIGKNLKLFLKERNDIELIFFNKEHNINSLFEIIKKVDFIFHLAGINRSTNSDDFYVGNTSFTKILCETIKKTKRKIPLVFTSSIKAKENTPYGVSKKNAEDLLLELYKSFEIF